MLTPTSPEVRIYVAMCAGIAEHRNDPTLRCTREDALAFLTRGDDEAALQLASATAVAAEMVHGWLPIESAPRDGTDFLALCAYHKKHHQMVGCFAPNKKFVSWPSRLQYYPTHWQPLPAPPVIAAERDDG